MRYSVWFIAAAIVCLLTGMLAIFWWMTPSGPPTLLLSHVHLNLLGWATLALYGLVHAQFPKLASVRLAAAQFWLALVGAFALPVGFALPRDHPAHLPFMAIGTLAAFAAVVLFAVMFFGTVAFSKEG